MPNRSMKNISKERGPESKKNKKGEKVRTGLLRSLQGAQRSSPLAFAHKHHGQASYPQT